MSKTYVTRGRAAPLNHQVYELYLKKLNISPADASSLLGRGLTMEKIKTCGYATKPSNKSRVAEAALAEVNTEFQLDGVPGFYINDQTGHRAHHGIFGIAIPIRDVIGNINSILVRNANPTEKNGRVINKYLTFSTGGKTKGAKVWQITHCPIVKGLPRDAAGTTIRITEGVLKADVATALGEFYCIGIQGLKIHDDIDNVFDELEVAEVRICLDAGEETSDIKLARARLIKKVREYGADVEVEIWDAQYGKGIDDVLKAGHADKVRCATKEEIDKMLEEANENDPNNGEWYYCIGTERFVNTVTFREYKKSQFCDKFKLHKVDAVNAFLTSFDYVVESMTFAPGQGLVVIEKGEPCLNTWRDPKITPVEGDITPFLEHLAYLFPDEQQRNILLDYMAFILQHPGKKIRWLLIIIGGQGVGKSYFGTVFEKLLGKDNISKPNNDQLHEKFSGWQVKCQLVIIEELMAIGRRELANKLKTMITEDTAMVREMNREAYAYPNRYNIVAFTNYDDALPLEDTDRRYAVLKSDATRQLQRYYDHLFSWTEKPESIQALYHFLLARDISSFSPNARAPETQAKKSMIDASRAPLEAWIHNCVADQCWPFNGEIVCIRHLKSLDGIQPEFRKASDQKWAAVFKKLDFIKGPLIALSDKSKATPWFIGPKKQLLGEQTPGYLAQYYEKNRPHKDDNVNPIADSEPL